VELPIAIASDPTVTTTVIATELPSGATVVVKPPPVFYANAPNYFAEALKDAERLLKYAAENGLDLDTETRDHILQARSAHNGAGWTEETAANLLSALTILATRLRPVTAESLSACTSDTQSTVRGYLRIALWLAVVIVPFSIASFVTSAISTAIRNDITTANDLAVKLRAELGPLPAIPPGAQSLPATGTPSASTQTAMAAPPAVAFTPPAGMNVSEIVSELQLFASTTRAIDARARQLNVLVFNAERDPFAAIRKNPAALHEKFQLPSGLENLALAANERTDVYQDVRYFAQNLLDDVSFFYGAMGTCILPVLYALLGTCAYLLRNFERQMSMRTFTPSRANSARFLIAAIGGAVVGLFNNFTITQAASIPPLAIAFLVGYAVDVFFTFLEGLIQAFTRNMPATSSSSTTAMPSDPVPPAA
jgi:hypothetical protein